MPVLRIAGHPCGGPCGLVIGSSHSTDSWTLKREQGDDGTRVVTGDTEIPKAGALRGSLLKDVGPPALLRGLCQDLHLLPSGTATPDPGVLSWPLGVHPYLLCRRMSLGVSVSHL